MKPIRSALENQISYFAEMKSYLQQHQFTLGGNWEYDRGCFDRALDDANKVWLRLPFEVVQGQLDDSEAPDPSMQIRMGEPYVLKHLYREHNDPEAEASMFSALIDQFQAPLDRDAEVEESWVEAGAKLLRKVEQGL